MTSNITKSSTQHRHRPKEIWKDLMQQTFRIVQALMSKPARRVGRCEHHLVHGRESAQNHDAAVLIHAAIAQREGACNGAVHNHLIHHAQRSSTQAHDAVGMLPVQLPALISLATKHQRPQWVACVFTLPVSHVISSQIPAAEALLSIMPGISAVVATLYARTHLTPPVLALHCHKRARFLGLESWILQ